MVQVKVTGTVKVADSGQAKASPGEAFTGKSRWDLALDTLMRVWITAIVCKCARDNFHHLFDSFHYIIRNSIICDNISSNLRRIHGPPISKSSM